MYSQNNEDEIIAGLVGERKNGSFLDIGAYNGKTFSNTLRLVTDLKWGGVCVEPAPGPFKDLLELHGKNPAIKLINVAVSATGGWAEFWDSNGDAVSTLDPAHQKKWKAGYNVDFRPYRLFAVSVENLLSETGTDFDLVNLDVEGLNWQLFCALPERLLLRASVVCIEHDNRIADITQRLARYGYAQRASNGENIILSR